MELYLCPSWPVNGFSADKNKDACLVARVFITVKVNLGSIQVFHTDRGNEFKNQSIEELQYQLADYANWFNNHRIH